jgi:predicted MFS family arabinose efflux permease
MAGRYSSIFALGGVMVAISVLFFIPLKEDIQGDEQKPRFNLLTYFRNLIECCKNMYFRRLIYTQVFSSISTAINTFVYIIAQNYVNVGTEWISYMIIIQTVGVFAGGLVTGRISEHFGSKRTLLLTEGLHISIPVLEIAALFWGHGQVLMFGTAFLIGFIRSGNMAYQSHLLELSEKEKSIFYIVTKSMLLLPFTFSSIAVGLFVEHVSLPPVLFFQIVVATAALFCAFRLKLFVYKRG